MAKIVEAAAEMAGTARTAATKRANEIIEVTAEMTGTTAAWTSYTPGTTTSAGSLAAGRGALTTTGVTRRMGHGSIALLYLS